MAKTKKQKQTGLQKFIYGKWFGPCMVVLCFLFLLLVRVTVNLPTFGDEPHYLVMDSSLLHDHDLNLKNNYANRDYASFFDGTLMPQGNPVNPNDVRSIHGDGLPFLLLPGFAIAGKSGAAVTMVGVAVAVVWLTYVWTKQITGRKKYAYIAAGALTISYFFANLAGYDYPDMPLAGIFLAALIILDKYYMRPWFQFLLGSLLGFGLLLHFRTLVFIVPVFVILAWRLWRSERKLPWQAVLGFLMFGGIYYYHETYMSTTSIAPTANSSSASLTGNPVANLSAMLFDSNKGLFSFNPILLLIPLGLPIWFKQHKRSLIIALLALAPTIYVTVKFIEWHGGYAPTGRYMMSILPALMPALAFALIKLTARWQKIVVWVLGGITAFITFDAMRSHYPLIDPNTWTRHRLFDHVQHLTGLTVDKLLPAFITDLNGDVTHLVHPTPTNIAKVVLWYGIVIALGVYGWLLSRTPAPKKVKR